MKKIHFLLFIATISFGFSSCKKDVVVKKAPVSNDISGNWKLASATNEYVFGVKSVLTINHPLPADTIDHINFKADGTGVLLKTGVAIARFKYDATDSVIHFTNVIDNTTNELLGTGAFVRLINELGGGNMKLTTKWFPSYGVYFYGNDRYDQVQYHSFFKKEN